jgi:hypothetical protein
MVKLIFAIAQVVVGLIGAWWLIAGLAGIVKAGLDHAWGPTFTGALFALSGSCLAYSAFVRFPWEAGRSDRLSKRDDG